MGTGQAVGGAVEGAGAVTWPLDALLRASKR